MTAWSLLEVLLRGAAAGILVLSAAYFFRAGKGFGTERLASLFLVGTAAYVVISSPAFSALPRPVWGVLIALATSNSVFFWWFATALFDDEFEWSAWRLVPFALTAGLFLFRLLLPDSDLQMAGTLLQQAVIIALTLHVLWLALAHRRDDLLEKRRAFRLVFAVLAGLLGLAIAIAELALNGAPAPQFLLLLHAAALFGISLGLTLWVLPEPAPLRPPPAPQAGTAPPVPEEMKAELVRLERAMQERVYAEDGLTIAALANRLGLPEYKLRRLINGALGFSNFNAFLNSYRLSDARAILSNPAEARRQITQIALDLGYGSVGPFNRAFKLETGLTPTEYRRKALAET